MTNHRTLVFAPHDDGSGAFGVLSRVARALLRVADTWDYELHLYFLNSSVAVDGQTRLNSLLLNLHNQHRAILVPVDNLIWLPKDKDTAAVIGARIPDILRKWVGPLWHDWPCAANWIRPNLPTMSREEWSRPEVDQGTISSRATWKERALRGCGALADLSPEWWQGVALGISMGVPQLHRVARHAGFPSIEVGDWFFSVGLRGCMRESKVSPDIIATTEPILRMIEEDEFKARETWLTLYQAPHDAYMEHLANSPVRFREMTGLLWTGDRPPNITSWSLASSLRQAMDADIAQVRGTQAQRVVYIVPGTTSVWNGIIELLRHRSKGGSAEVAIVDLKRNGTLTLLEDGGWTLQSASRLLQNLPSEEMHLATCRACDLGITRTAGGVLSFAETQRPSVLIDEPGHWLGHIQRDQCQKAGLCVVVQIDEFRSDPASAIQEQANQLGMSGSLDATGAAARDLKVGAESELAEYLFKTYIV